MFPFVVLGYVIKPLQLKGASWLYLLLNWPKCIFHPSLTISDTGFAPAESQKALTSVETAVSEDQGAMNYDNIPSYYSIKSVQFY